MVWGVVVFFAVLFSLSLYIYIYRGIIYIYVCIHYIYIFEYLPVCLITFVFLFVFVHITKKAREADQTCWGGCNTPLPAATFDSQSSRGCRVVFRGFRVMQGYVGLCRDLEFLG